MRKKDEIYDFRPLAKAIKEARNSRGMTRDQAAPLIPIASRYLTNIENKGQHPSLHVFNKLVTLFELSVDQFFYPETSPKRSTRRRQLDELLDNLDDSDLIIVEATIKGIAQAREAGEM
jgi:DNA-binding XRE family transcriptional regulator